MGDRCYLSLQCKASDAKRFETELNIYTDEWETENEEPPDGIIIMTGDEVNYAGYTELHAFAKEGLTFLGHHSEGGDYPGGMFAATGGEIAWLDAWKGEPFVIVNEDGTINPNDVAHVKAYYALEARARLALGYEAAPATSAPQEA